MREFFRSRLFIFAVVVVIVSVIMLIASVTGDGRATPFSNMVGAITAPFQKAAGRVAQSVSELFSYMYEVDALKDENERLKNELSAIEARLREAETAEQENEKLRVLLELKQKDKSFIFEMAEIIAVNTGNWGTSYTIDKGEVHGIEMNDCVVTEQGMVGYVSTLGSTFAQVTTVIDTDMQCGAMVSRSRETAVAEGDFEWMQQARLKLSYLKNDADILIGDAVETSGLGGLFPKGVLIGTVEKVAVESHGISNYAVVRPAVDFSTIKKVFIITDFEIQE